MPKPIENVACHCLQFRRSTANVIEFYDRKLAPSGVSIRQYSLLKAIGNNQGCNVRQLGEVTVLDRSTLARTLKPLIRQGLVINDKAPGARDSRLVLSPRGEPVRQQAAENEVLIAPYDAKNIYMVMYHNEGLDWNPEQEGVVDLFNEYYGGGMNGIVFQELREARGLAYSAAAYYVTPDKKGDKEFCQTYIITQNDKMMDAVNQFHVILNQMPASEAAFQIAKDALTKQLASQRTTKSGVLNAYIVAQRKGIDYDLNEKVYNALPAMKLQDIVDFEQQHMANKAYRYIILGDEKELDMKALEKIGPIKRLTQKEVFGY